MAQAASIACSLAAAWVHAYPAHYLVVREDAAGTLEVVAHRRVDLSGAPGAATQDKADRLGRGLAATVKDKSSGKTLFATNAVTSPWLRGEFHGEGRMDSHLYPSAAMEYVVRVPATPSSVLELQSEGREKRALQLDLDSFDAKAAVAPPPGWATGVIGNNGDPANRVDLLIVAEGYTDSQLSQFMVDAQRLADNFFSISPYSDFRHLFNVRWLFVPSAQSGADKPACAETPGAPVVSVDTAFDATYCTAGVRRLVTVNNAKVLSAAGTVPDWDQIFVLVNDPEYGGSGGGLSVATTDGMSAQIMQHEFGHTFTRLADQYETPFPGYPPCSDLAGSTSPCESNVTDDIDRARLKWRNWIGTGTAIPTTSPLNDPLAAGAWVGARFQSSGMYRSCYSGIMRFLSQPFCDVETDAFLKRLYGGGWGSPATGVSLIEPGSTPDSASVSGPIGSSVAFRAVVAGSRLPGGLNVTWRVDGAVARSDPATQGTMQTFSFVVPDTGPHTIELIVADNTTMTLSAPTRSRQWTVTGSNAVGVTPTGGAGPQLFLRPPDGPDMRLARERGIGL